MILSLYLVVVCFCAYIELPEYGLTDASLVALALGIAFFWIANACYDRTISNLKKEIRELRKDIEHLKV